VEADIALDFEWHGVKHCGDAERARAEITAAYDRWIGQQALAHTGQRLGNSGWGPADYKAVTYKTNGKHRCTGSLIKAPVFAEFY